MKEFKVGDMVKVTTPVIVFEWYKDEVGVVSHIRLPSFDTEDPEQVIEITYFDGTSQTAYVETDGVVLAERTKEKAPTEITEGTSKGTDNVNSPSHYGQGNIEAIEYIKDFLTKEEFIGYLRGNIAKYLHRWRYKNGLEDLEKAQVYLGWLIKEVGGTDIHQLNRSRA